MTHEEADQLIRADSRNLEVIFPVINGQEVNNQPNQQPQRKAINFSDWSVERAQNFDEPFERIFRLVKPVRDKDNMRSRREKWWQFGALASGLYKNIHSLERCFVAAATTKYLNFSIAPTNYIFLNTLYVFTTDRWDLYAVVQSTLHEVWARKYSGALKQDLRYSPSKCFDTFPFPEGMMASGERRAASGNSNPLAARHSQLAELGEFYHEHRRTLMRQLWLGLTDIYNLFHTRDLTPERVAKVSKKTLEEAEADYHGILELRRLHRELDQTVLDAYGWGNITLPDESPDADHSPLASHHSPINLGHDFHEVETLPENDRVRYTLSPEARKEVLKRLLALNHQRAAEQASVIVTKTKPKRGKKSQTAENQADLFL